MKIKLYPFTYAFILFAAMSCRKLNNYSNIKGEVLKEWKSTLSSENENHINGGSETTASLNFQVLSDNSIQFDINVDSSTDKILKTQINLGDPVTDGPVIYELPARIANSYISGVIKGIRQSLIDTLLDDSIDKYINVISENAPNGLVRGQLNTEVVFSKNVALSGDKVVSSVPTTSTGIAYLRITAGKTLYSKVTVNNIENTDPVTSAAINQGIEGANGSEIITLAASDADFETGKKLALSDAEYGALSTSNYVIVTSVQHTNGKLRGQVRE